jgi:hypothetical protein
MSCPFPGPGEYRTRIHRACSVPYVRCTTVTPVVISCVVIQQQYTFSTLNKYSKYVSIIYHNKS